MTKPTSVYIIVSGEHVKIGVAIDPAKRVKGVRTGSPEGAHLYGSREFRSSQSARHTEKRLHRLFWKNRGSGEWFRISPATALKALRKIKEQPQGWLESKGGYGWREISDDEGKEALERAFGNTLLRGAF